MTRSVMQCLLWLFGALLTGAQQPITLHPVAENDLPLNGAGGCSLQLPHSYAAREGEFVFIADFEGQALINLDNAPIILKLTKAKGHDLKAPGSLGDRATNSYSAAGLAVEVDFLATQPCPGGNSACKATRYDATITVKRGKARKTFAAKASCAVR